MISNTSTKRLFEQFLLFVVDKKKNVNLSLTVSDNDDLMVHELLHTFGNVSGKPGEVNEPFSESKIVFLHSVKQKQVSTNIYLQFEAYLFKRSLCF